MSKETSPAEAIHMFEIQTDLALKYGINLPARTVQLVGAVDENMFLLVETALTLMEDQSRSAITFRINSLGGSVYDALAIVGRMRSSKCKINTEGFGAVMSAATLILAAGNKRKMSSFGWVMHHEGQLEGVEGTVEQMRHLTSQLEREEEAWTESMAKFTTAPADFWAKQGKLGKDLFLTADQCLDLGVVDEVF
jgi:ATP-dependent Clp protease protease subunit